MTTIGKAAALLTALLMAPTALAASSKVGGTWATLPSAPSAVLPSASVWTGRQLIVVGHRPFTSVAVAESYDPSARAWKQLSPPAKLGSDPYCCTAVWSGREVLVFGAFVGAAYNPATSRWRRLRAMPTRGGKAVWDGRELLVIGGGRNARIALAFSPATNRWRRLAPLPLSAADGSAAWTGKRVLLWASSHGA